MLVTDTTPKWYATNGRPESVATVVPTTADFNARRVAGPSDCVTGHANRIRPPTTVNES